jgi:four helix bundle protein
MPQIDVAHPFPHHRLDAYHVALQMAQQGRQVADRVPRGYRSFADQLMRSSGAVVLLIGEGANRYSAAQKVQRFSEARAEAGETAAAAELLATLRLVPQAEAQSLCALAGRVAAMLTGLIRRLT